jgi:hypothetical protein
LNAGWHFFLILFVLAFGASGALSQVGMNEINSAWLAFEHERLHEVEQWPDSPRKQAVIGAIESTLGSLSRHPGLDAKYSCLICGSRQGNLRVLELPESREPVAISAAWTELEKTG